MKNKFYLKNSDKNEHNDNLNDNSFDTTDDQYNDIFNVENPLYNNASYFGMLNNPPEIDFSLDGKSFFNTDSSGSMFNENQNDIVSELEKKMLQRAHDYDNYLGPQIPSMMSYGNGMNNMMNSMNGMMKNNKASYFGMLNKPPHFSNLDYNNHIYKTDSSGNLLFDNPVDSSGNTLFNNKPTLISQPSFYHPTDSLDMDYILGNTPGSFMGMAHMAGLDLAQEKTFKIKLHDILFGNTVHITSIDAIGKEIFKNNISTLKIKLEHNVDENISHDMSDYLYGKRYRLATNGTTIHQGYLTHNSIFPTRDIPFHLLTHHDIEFVIYDVTEKEVVNNNDLQIKITLNKSNKMYHKTLISGSGLLGVIVPWGTIENHGILIENELRIIEGMCGRAYTDSHRYPENYLKSNSTTLKLKNGVTLIKATKSLPHFVDNYCSDVAVLEIVNPSYHVYCGKLLILETLYFNNIKCNQVFRFYIPGCDTLTNMYITIKQNSNLISAKLKDINLSFVEMQIDDIGKKRYKITNFDNILHYSCVSNQPMLELKFDVKTKINIQYDRGIGQAKIRKALVHTYTGIPMGMPLQANFVENNPINLSNMIFENE